MILRPNLRRLVVSLSLAASTLLVAACGARTISRSQLVTAEPAGNSACTGLYYVGSDEHWHYFVQEWQFPIVSDSLRLPVAQLDLSTCGLVPIARTSRRARWQPVGADNPASAVRNKPYYQASGHGAAQIAE